MRTLNLPEEERSLQMSFASGFIFSEHMRFASSTVDSSRFSGAARSVSDEKIIVAMNIFFISFSSFFSCSVFRWIEKNSFSTLLLIFSACYMRSIPKLGVRELGVRE